MAPALQDLRFHEGTGKTGLWEAMQGNLSVPVCEVP